MQRTEGGSQKGVSETAPRVAEGAGRASEGAESALDRDRKASEEARRASKRAGRASKASGKVSEAARRALDGEDRDRKTERQREQSISSSCPTACRLRAHCSALPKDG